MSESTTRINRNFAESKTTLKEQVVRFFSRAELREMVIDKCCIHLTFDQRARLRHTDTCTHDGSILVGYGNFPNIWVGGGVAVFKTSSGRLAWREITRRDDDLLAGWRSARDQSAT